MAGRAVCQTDDKRQRYDWFCDMHHQALAISTIGAVRQIITPTDTLISEFEVQVGAIPFLRDFTPFSYSGGMPLVITGALVSTADLTPACNGTAWHVYMDTLQVKGSNIPLLRQVLDTGRVQLESQTLANVLESTLSSYKTPRALFYTTYLDDQFRISRDQDDNAFFYVKTSNDTTVTDFSKVDADLGILSLLGGFNDAISKIYL
jgi:hypothetical protein